MAVACSEKQRPPATRNATCNRDVNARPAGSDARPHGAALGCIHRTGLPLLMLVLCSCGCDRQQTLTPQVPDGHARMVATLKVIGNSGLEERMQFGLNTVENEEQSLSFLPESLSEQRFALLCQLGKRRMWLGDTKQAIAHYVAAVELVEDHKQSTPQPVRISSSKWVAIFPEIVPLTAYTRIPVSATTG